jgi:hypothetical protein
MRGLQVRTASGTIKSAEPLVIERRHAYKFYYRHHKTGEPFALEAFVLGEMNDGLVLVLLTAKNKNVLFLPTMTFYRAERLGPGSHLAFGGEA